MNPRLEQAARCLVQGDLVVYPTETFYALGADALNQQALLRIVALKGRDPAKPLPVIIAGLDQLGMVSDWQSPDLHRLIRTFWPGPLSVLVPARPGLPGLMQDSAGFTAVRWTPHPGAQALARMCKAPLAATSANISGRQPVWRPEDLDPALALSVAMVLDHPPLPAGGMPSTLVRIVGHAHLEIIRQGAVGMDLLARAGWKVRTNS